MRMTRPVASCFTYSLGKSLYIPLTSRCNTCTLPETRGPNFTLPSEVVATLCRVRDAGNKTERWKHWCMYLDTQESPQKMPEAQDIIATLEGTTTANGQGPTDDDGLFPCVEELSKEAQQQIETGKFESVVIGGEGEPTMRLAALVGLAKNLEENELPVRLTTNGLIYNGLIYKDTVAEVLKSSGISSVSVALMTHDPNQYDYLMKPKAAEIISISRDAPTSPHAAVCQFIQKAIETGLTVEATGVLRQDVNQGETEEFAKALGVTEKFRWRSYFP